MKSDEKEGQINEKHPSLIPLKISKANILKAKQLFLATKFSLTQIVIDQLSDPLKEIRIAMDQKDNCYYAKIIKSSTMIQHHLHEQLRLNQQLLGTIDNYLFPQHFLKIQGKIHTINSIGLISQPYQYTLEQYIQQQKLKPQQVLLIFDQIMKTVYSLYCEHHFKFQLRSKHFVFSKNKWKLQSLAWLKAQSYKNNIELEYLWSKEHQSPEQYHQKSVYSKKDFEQMQVWNLGCILLEMLVGYHSLRDNESITQLQINKYQFIEGILQDSETNISKELKSVLTDMLQCQPSRRLTLPQLFTNEYLSPSVAKFYHQHNHKEQLVKIPRHFLNEQELYKGNVAKFMSQELEVERQLNQAHIMSPSLSFNSDSEENGIQFNLQLEDPQPQEQLPIKSNQDNYQLQLQQLIKEQQNQQPIKQPPIYDETICKLCYINQSQMINQNCGHVATCQTCWKVYTKQQIHDEHPCVICRTPGRYYKYKQPIFF